MDPTTEVSEQDAPVPIGWAILELMGHRRLGGFVTEQEIAGRGFLRIEIPGEGDAMYAVQFYSPTAVYCITPSTEAAARVAAASSRPEPVKRWELPAPAVADRGLIGVDDDGIPY